MDAEKQLEADSRYMRRALRLAEYGAGHASPNPMVGAVIVARGRVIGEGWHRRCGGPHAEVNAVRSVSPDDERLLPESTIYVTLEPCSHYGKTPPCSLLLIEKGIPRIVIGTEDPFAKVSGRGIRMLREAGREVVTGVLRRECRDLNRRFITAHTLGRPWIQLKWAQTADRIMGATEGAGRLVISNPATMQLMHRERAMADAILVGTGTVIADNPSLTTRLWPGSDARPAGFDSPRLPADSRIMQRQPLLKRPDETLGDFLHRLYAEEGITSLMVEGGAATLQSFLETGLYDEIRVETAPRNAGGGIPAPEIPAGIPLEESLTIRGNRIDTYRRQQC